MNPLTVFITRMKGASEWEDNSVWGFDPNTFVAFIRHGSVDSVKADEFSQERVKDHVQDDVWVINGTRFKSWKGALDRVDWARLGRRIIVKVHRGEGKAVSEEDWQEMVRGEERPNLRYLLEQASDYSGAVSSLFEPIKEYARAKDNKPDEYHRALRKLHEALGISVPRIQYVIDLLQLFLPLDVELQLVESQSDDKDFSRCRNAARVLESSTNEMALLLSKVTKHDVTPQQLEPLVAEVVMHAENLGNVIEATGEEGGESSKMLDGFPSSSALGLLRDMLAMIHEVNTVENREGLLALFGGRVIGGQKRDGSRTPDLDERGFHRTYEKLRDALLKIVESD